uniref:F-box domain-containing protein n=1 Tax=Davidia involucrata TaxID=16924 RepID=A0A5B6YU07_DAVIN
MASDIESRQIVQRPPDQFSAAAESIAGSDDLITEILQLLPAKSLMRFKSVSKRWLSLISDHHFSLLWQQHRNPNSQVSGLFSRMDCLPQSEFEFIPLDGAGGEDESFSRFPDFGNCGDIINTNIIGSCKGLFLCCSIGLYDDFPKCKSKYHVYNPTTKQFATLPWLCDTDFIDGMNLAFDPSKSPYYKVVSLRRRRDQFYQIELYSSENGSWRPSGDPFEAPSGVNFSNGVFCNGAINWLCSSSKTSLCFDVDQEQLRTIPSPPKQSPINRVYRHFGESQGHLHLIEYNGYFCVIIKVYEMERDCSKWFLKDRIQLRTADLAFQDMLVLTNLSINKFGFSVLCLIRKEIEEDSVLVLYVSGNIISYNFRDNTSKKLCDVGQQPGYLPSLQRFGHLYVHQYIETLFRV